MEYKVIAQNMSDNTIQHGSQYPRGICISNMGNRVSMTCRAGKVVSVHHTCAPILLIASCNTKEARGASIFSCNCFIACVEFWRYLLPEPSIGRYCENSPPCLNMICQCMLMPGIYRWQLLDRQRYRCGFL